MPKSVSRNAAAALYAGRKFTNGKNTKVDGGNLYLFGNHIARDAGQDTAITNRGWFTLTTKDRLNALENVSISQRRGVWYLNGREWDGSWVVVDKTTGSWAPEIKVW